jgi:sulfate transport system ATP-binding protein
MKIDIVGVNKRFGETPVLHDINLSIASGELVALLGPSGSGKTTLLRIIAGLEWPEEGEVRFDGQNALHHTVGERNVGFVFQSYALFRHMSVFENIAFGLRARPRSRRPSDSKIRQRVNDLLDIVQLKSFADRLPSQLSGGQRQRVALARALATDPGVLLLDEPFGALDAKVRKELRRWLRQLHRDIHVTSVFVTHDQEEALEMADRVVLLDKGHIEQAGSPQQVYEQPASAFVHDFIGESIVVPVDVERGEVRFEGKALGLQASDVAGRARLYLRPYDIAVVHANNAVLKGPIKRITGLGASRHVEIALFDDGDHTIEIEVPRNEQLAVGQEIGLRLRTYRVFPAI